MLIIGVAMSMVSAARPGAAEGDGLMSGLYWKLTDGLRSAIVKTVTGDSDSPYEAIDKMMQIAMTSTHWTSALGKRREKFAEVGAVITVTHL